MIVNAWQHITPVEQHESLALEIIFIFKCIDFYITFTSTFVLVLFQFTCRFCTLKMFKITLKRSYCNHVDCTLTDFVA